MITNFRPEFINRYTNAIYLYEKANMRLAEGDADDTLTASRKCLEFFAKDFSRMCNLAITDSNTGMPLSIEELIDNLMAYGYIRQNESEILHQLRRLGNVGSHDIGTMEQAQEAVNLLDKAVMIFAERDARISGEKETAVRYNDASHLGWFAQILANSPLLYRLFAEFTLTPFIPAVYALERVSRETVGTMGLLLAMLVVVVSVWLHGKLTAYLNAIPVPEGGCAGMILSAVRFLNVLTLPALIFMVFLCTASYSAFLEKIIVWIAIALCVCISHTLRVIARFLLSV